MIPKFRAWVHEDEEMAKVDSINFFNHEVELSETTEIIEASINEVELMQSTGLKDKNGVEVFEGDVVKNSKGEIGSVVYLIQEASWVVVTKRRDYRLGHRNTGEAYLVANNHEVIGNVREHPHLLEGAGQ